MWNRVSGYFVKTGLFLLAFVTLFILSIQIRYLPENTYMDTVAEHHRAGLYLILGALVLWIVMKGCRIIQKIPEKYNKTVVGVFLGIIFAGQMVYIFTLKPGLYADPFTLAYTAKAGLPKSLEYYMIYPMQLVMTMLIHFWNKIVSLFGIADLLTADAVLAAVCMDISVYFAFKTVENILQDTQKARVLLVFAALNPSIYLWGSYLYTHVVSLMFMTADIYFILRLKGAQKKEHVICCTAIVMVLSYCGASIRSNGIFAILALAVCCMLDFQYLKKNKIRIVYYIVPSIMALSLAVGGMHMAKSCYMKSEGVYEFDASDTKMPMVYWFLIGFSSGTGFPCFFYIADLPTQEEKVEKSMEKIVEFAAGRDFKETVEWIEDQWRRVFGIGHTFGWYQLNIYRNNIGHVRNFLEVDRGIGLWIYSQILLMILFLCIFVCILHEFIYGRNGISKIFFICVIFAGAIVYQVIGETQPSYQMAWITVLLILATVGYVWWCECVSMIKDRLLLVNVVFLQRGLAAVFSLLMLMTAVYMFYFSAAFTKTDVLETNYVVSVTERDGELAGESIMQSFKAKEPFNHVSLDIIPHAANRAKPLKYELSLLNSKKGTVASQVFDIHQLDGEKMDMAFAMVYPQKEEIYYLLCRPIYADKDNYIAVSTFDEKVFDLYAGGTLCVDGVGRCRDAKFNVYAVTATPYVSKVKYYLAFGFVLFLELCIYREFLRLYVSEHKKKQVLPAEADSKENNG